jgi:hypothetical protein
VSGSGSRTAAAAGTAIVAIVQCGISAQLAVHTSCSKRGALQQFGQQCTASWLVKECEHVLHQQPAVVGVA